MDKGLSARKTPLKARELFPAGEVKETEVVVSARSHGVVVAEGSEQRTIAWSKAIPEAFFKKEIYDRVFSSGDAEDNLVLACLAVELKQPEKTIRNFKGNFQMLVDEETYASRVRQLFGE